MSPIDHPLDFEKPLVELEIVLETIRDELAGGNESRRGEYAKLEAQLSKLRKEIYGKLTPYQRVQLSRHFDRPFTLDYIKYIFTDFMEFHGDRLGNDDAAIVGGTAKLGEVPIMIIGHQRGRTTQERLKRNFGMPNPEGYRKALRLFKMAEKFRQPIITFIDTQGAYPGLEAEERGQAEAIAMNLEVLSEISVPIISVVIGEGGSGGALALGVSDRILMLENACYSVITPEGCASILWPGEASQEKTAVAAEALKITAQDLKQFKLIDDIVPEPAGGAHFNHKEAAESLRGYLVKALEPMAKITTSELLEKRYQKYRMIGAFTGDN